MRMANDYTPIDEYSRDRLASWHRWQQLSMMGVAIGCVASVVVCVCLSVSYARNDFDRHHEHVTQPQLMSLLNIDLDLDILNKLKAKYSGLTDASPPPSNDAKQHKHSLKGLPPPNTPDPQVDPEPSESIKGEFEYGAVSVDSIPCAKIGKDVMLRGGNSIDSAVATMYCNSVINSQSMGLGGGFIMTIYLANGTSLALIARETAPAAATKDMFEGNANLSHYGPLASGVPGFILGTWELKQRLGNPSITWESLLQPSVDLCFNGIEVNFHAYHMMHQERERIYADPGLSAVFVNPKTGKIWNEGDVYTYKSLGETIQSIAKEGPGVFYNGHIGENMVKDVQAAGGILTVKDLQSYRVQWEETVSYKLKNSGFTLISSPPPGSGVITNSILAIMDLYKPSPMDKHRPLLWHRFIEACKFSFAKRTEMGDWTYAPIRDEVKQIVKDLSSHHHTMKIKEKINDFQTSQDPEFYGAKTTFEEDHGTCHHCFLSPQGDAISVTASVNLIWGCKFMSPSTGIIMNNQMDDFASPNITSAYNVPPAPNNFIYPGKRPMSSMSTTIVVDDQGRVVAVAGASGGTKIISATAQVLMNV
ncbi:glutathione hydrolase 2 isoform X3 [Eurytemora carolleeae]|nr:glutathione hydrolase 2 isoform X3 [Eurytemora carolleeae]|eukprot:XP_023328042.1 glutathione hydrolase 2-like isoform X3 [Eurytemora affinis]